MAENNLFQLAQVVTELPVHHLHQQSSTHPRSNRNHQPLLVRKNACIVCTICFTCSKYYGVNCECSETQPRRGKNLPENGLDSRAKKLSQHDKEDYDFTLRWLDEFAHPVYRDRHHRIVELQQLTEVSLCKAHSSTLYRAKKRHQRNVNQHQAPPSPADSNGTIMDDTTKRRSSSVESYLLLPQPQQNQEPITTSILPQNYNYNVGVGTLAAKVREVSFQHQYNRHPDHSPDFSMMTTSTSSKRKRLSRPPSSSASTPLLYSNQPQPQHQPIFQPYPTNTRQQPTSSFSSQLPPLHLRTPSLTSLSSTLQQQLHVTPSNYTRLPYKVIETVSLKRSPTMTCDDMEMDNDVYYVQNLAITDTYTFRDLLSEIDFAGSPPPGKRIIISDDKRERVFPLGQAIRSVIRYPTDTHVEFYLGLAEKASINWSSYK